MQLPLFFYIGFDTIYKTDLLILYKKSIESQAACEFILKR